jgi:hypothetical protein
MSDGDESRSDRLRRRRQRRQTDNENSAKPDETVKLDNSDDPSKLDGTAKPDKPDKTSKPDETSKSDGTSKPDEKTKTVKTEQTPVYMYLPEAQDRELQRLYSILKAKYEYEVDEEFEKNRHFYPLVVQYGLDGLDSLDVQELQELLEQIPQ